MKAIGRAIMSAIFLVLTGLMLAAAKYAPQLVFSFYPAWSRKALAALSSVSALLPIALWEVLAGLAILWLLYTFVCIFTRRRGFLNWLTGVLLAVCVGVFLFTGLWGLNHFGPGVGETLGLDVREYSKKELIAATNYYAAQATQYAGTVQRDEQGRAQFADFQTLSKQAGDGYLSLRSAYPQFDGAVDPVKSLLSWRLFSQFGTTGIFICFTGESCVSTTTHTASMPFTMCHEIGHRMAFAREDEANFAGFLACAANERPEFRYSGYYAAFRYCYNALYQADPQAALEVWSGVCAEIAADWNASVEHYEAIRSETAAEVTDDVYDTYLKSFSVESGVRSYGEVTDLLLDWYFGKVR